MPEARVNALRCVDIGVTDLEAAKRFYTDVWLLRPIAEQDGVLFLRGSGPTHHIVTLRQARQPGLLRIALSAPDRNTVDALFGRVRSAGAETAASPAPSTQPGGGYGFAFKDPEGRNFAIVSDVEDHAASAPDPLRPTKLSHVNLNSGAHDTSHRFLADVLGFTTSDVTRQFRFLRCSADHHSLVLGFNEVATLNHIAFELPNIEALMYGIGRMRDHGYPIEWGPGRHGPGNNAFAYFVGPEEMPLEYTAEMQQVTASHKPREPHEWTWPPGRVDHWGLTPGPSARVKRVQTLFGFPEDGHVLPI